MKQAELAGVKLPCWWSGECTLYVTVPVSVLKRVCWYGTKLF